MTIRQHDLVRIVQTTHMLRRVWVFVLLLGLYSCLPVLKEHSALKDFADLPSDLFSILGLVLSLVLVFRTNRAYDRWWEGRILWGKLVNISRNTAIKFRRFADLNPEQRIHMQHSLAGFAYALKDHLRDGVQLNTVPGWEENSASPNHVPGWITSEMYNLLNTQKEAGKVSPQELLAIDTDLHEFLNVCGGCERIRNTLIAGSYRSYALKSLIVYLMVLPWGLVHELNLLTIPVTMIIGYMMVGLETIADAVEEPFGKDLDDLNLEKLCLTIDITTAEILEVEPTIKS